MNENIDVQVTGKTDLATPETQNLITAVIPQSVADKLEHVPGAEKVTPQVFSEGAGDR